MLSMIVSKANIQFDDRIDDAHLGEWTLLEFALMLGHQQCAEVLLRNGATIDVESYPLERRLQRIRKSTVLIIEEIQFLRSTNIHNEASKLHKYFPSSDEKVDYLEKRLLQMKKMKTVLDNTIVPGPLTTVEAVVSAADQLTVSWEHVRHQNMDVVVNYKVEWSLCHDFNIIEGTLLVDSILNNYAMISGLKCGLRYTVRVSAASIRGFGPPTLATPRSLLLSIFPKSSKTIGKKKKGSIKNLFAGGFRSLKIMQRSVYLVSIIYSEMKVCTIEDYLPIILIDQTQFCIDEDEMCWALKLSLAWDEMPSLQKTNKSSSSNSRFHNKFIDAATAMHAALGVKDIGRVHYRPIVDEVNSVSFIVTVRFVSDLLVTQGSTTNWLPLNKIMRKRRAHQTMDALWAEILGIINFHECSNMKLQRGLYFCYMKLHSSINSINVVVPGHMPSILPHVLIRENPHITKEEWELLRSMDMNTVNPPATPAQLVFLTALVGAVSRILNDLDIDVDLMLNQRIYCLQLLPKIEDVCTLPNPSSSESTLEKSCLTLPLKIFEAIHFCTYNPELISVYCRLSLFIGHFSTHIQYAQRNSLMEKDIHVYATVLSKMYEFQQRLRNIWEKVRWISDVASAARDKQAKGIVSMQRLVEVSRTINDRRHHKQGTSGSNTSTDVSFLDPRNSWPKRVISLTNSLPEPEPWLDPCTKVIKVYTAYHHAHTCGVSVRLQITSKTTASEIVTLVIEHLAKSAARTDKTIESKDPDDFCLTVVLGSRERRLRDDFPLIKLKEPWDDGNLFVRHRDSVLEALQRGNEAAV